MNQTTSIILLLRLLSLGEGCLVESEHSVVTVNVLAVERMNKRKNVSDFDRIQIVVVRLVDSVGLVGSFKSAAVNTYQTLVRRRMTSNWRLVEVHPRPASALQRGLPGFIWWHKVAFQLISFGARHVGLSACIYPSWKTKAICLTSGSQCKSKGSLGLMKVFNISPTYLQWNSLVHMCLVWFIYYYDHHFYYYYYYSLLNIMQYVFLLFLNPHSVIPFRHYHWQAGFNLVTINISL